MLVTVLWSDWAVDELGFGGYFVCICFVVHLLGNWWVIYSLAGFAYRSAVERNENKQNKGRKGEKEKRKTPERTLTN